MNFTENQMIIMKQIDHEFRAGYSNNSNANEFYKRAFDSGVLGVKVDHNGVVRNADGLRYSYDPKEFAYSTDTRIHSLIKIFEKAAELGYKFKSVTLYAMGNSKELVGAIEVNAVLNLNDVKIPITESESESILNCLDEISLFRIKFYDNYYHSFLFVFNVLKEMSIKIDDINIHGCKKTSYRPTPEKDLLWSLRGLNSIKHLADSAGISKRVFDNRKFESYIDAFDYVYKIIYSNVKKDFNKDNKRPANRKRKLKTYIIKNNRNGLYKIGKSHSPRIREKTLQSEEPNISIIKTFAEDIEKMLHKEYDRYRVRGEWFELNNVQLQYICTNY